MAAKFCSRMESESRFAHLLRPIRDLTENWNIDIAKYLEEYLHEVIRTLKMLDVLRSFLPFVLDRGDHHFV